MKAKRELGIELLRIIACFLVVVIHIKLSDLENDGGIIKEQVLLSCLSGYAVAVFFAITGCFWYRQDKPFKDVIIKHVRTILIPTFVVIMIFLIFREYLFAENIIPTLADVSAPNMGNFFKGILSQTPELIGQHDTFAIYWYVIDFTLLLIWYPLVRVIVKDEIGEKIMWAFVIIAFINRAFEEIQWFTNWDFNIREISIVPMALVMTMLGHLIYSKKEFILNNARVCRICSAILYVLSILMSYTLQYKLYKVNPSVGPEFANWKHTPAFLIVISLLVFFISLDNLKIGNVAQKIILTISGFTFYVYLIHNGVTLKMMSTGFFWILRERMVAILSSHGKYLLVSFIMAVLVIAFSIPMCIVMKWLNKMIQRGIDGIVKIERKQN